MSTVYISCVFSGLILESFQMQNASSQISTVITITRGKLTIQSKPVELIYPLSVFDTFKSKAILCTYDDGYLRFSYYSTIIQGLLLQFV